MDSNFYIGQMVVCVDDENFSTVNPRYTYPKKGLIYTIRAIDEYDFDGLIVRLEEIINPALRDGEVPPPYVGLEGGFWLRRFRPVKRTSIDGLREIFAPMPKVTA